MPDEQITLQLGNFANYSATHFWNAQYFYTENEKESDLTRIFHYANQNYYPRTVIVDLKDNYGHATLRSPESNASISESNADINSTAWNGSLISYVQAPKQKSIYHQLWDSNEEHRVQSYLPTSQITCWDDFNYPFYHPKSIAPLPHFSISNVYEEGSALFSEGEWGNTMIESHLRFFAEACDHLTSFQIWASLDDAMSGVFSEAALLLMELYPKAEVFAHTFSFELHRNLALATSHLCESNLCHWSWQSSKSEFYAASAWPSVGIDTFLRGFFASNQSPLPKLIVPHLQSSCYSPFQPGLKCKTFHRGPPPLPSSMSQESLIYIPEQFPCAPPFPISNISQFTMSLHQAATLQALYPFLSQDLIEALEENVIHL
ncbi:mtDNA inheritance, partitioning of the mitochondrial organelle [Coelomomyces lativittatus]|nr:mtDNA inheritance, partitioning of the mitochondrial organelle [Coelomomyces lativittatus]KAJ1514759.1 mtDNA inheritance, partitioning of the mitochondrial organelle [Coelomomyces lativittatus]KAJ1516285.1 mtDNA inheritance, partitioning of the mitochondrial organelle [Coelomomyces lativittatus]